MYNGAVSATEVFILERRVAYKIERLRIQFILHLDIIAPLAAQEGLKYVLRMYTQGAVVCGMSRTEIVRGVIHVI